MSGKRVKRRLAIATPTTTAQGDRKAQRASRASTAHLANRALTDTKVYPATIHLSH